MNKKYQSLFLGLFSITSFLFLNSSVLASTNLDSKQSIQSQKDWQKLIVLEDTLRTLSLEERSSLMKTIGLSPEAISIFEKSIKLDTEDNSVESQKILNPSNSKVLKNAILKIDIANAKATDTLIKSHFYNMAAQGELYADSKDNYSYKGFCSSISSPISQYNDFIEAAKSLGGSSMPLISTGAFVYSNDNTKKGSVVCHDSDKGWAAVVSLKATKTGYCVDNTGVRKEVKKLSKNSIVCGK